MTRNPPQFAVSKLNPCGLDGIDFVEFVSNDPARLDALFKGFGFSKTMQHSEKPIDLYQQGDITFLVNRESRSFAAQFGALHGPSISSMGWRVKNAKAALEAATNRGAKARPEGDYATTVNGVRSVLPAVYGIGDSLIYFVDSFEAADTWKQRGFVTLEKPEVVQAKGFHTLDHLTNNVAKGTMQTWATFYKSVFGFEEVRYFDIRGAKTGLTVVRAPLAVRPLLHSHQRGRREEVANQRVPRGVQRPRHSAPGLHDRRHSRVAPTARRLAH